MQNNGGSAVSNYEWATHYDPTSAVALHRAGSVYLRTKDYKVAEEAFLKAVSVDPSFGPAYEELAELSYLGRNGARAVQYFEKYLSLTGNQEKDQVKYAFYLFMAKDFTKANEIFDRLAKQQNVSAVTLRYYAFSLFEAGAFEQSKSTFDRYFATAGKQEFEAADYAYYGKLLSKLNQDSLAAESISKSLSMEKNQPELTRVLAETQYKRKKYPEAIELYKQLMSGQKVLSQDYYSIGRAYYFNNQFEQADSSFLKLVELQPQMTVSFLWEGRTKANLDPETEKGLAKPYYEKLIELSLQKPDKSKNELIEAYSYLGYYHFLKGEVPVSKSYWNKVLALNPNDEKAKEAIRAFK
ncbi:MAG: tetratricopeptide repeat protein [Bacteroidota bacterium]